MGGCDYCGRLLAMVYVWSKVLLFSGIALSVLRIAWLVVSWTLLMA
jgi:hypothetical protein